MVLMKHPRNVFIHQLAQQRSRRLLLRLMIDRNSFSIRREVVGMLVVGPRVDALVGGIIAVVLFDRHLPVLVLLRNPHHFEV